MQKLYPINLSIEGRRCVVAGGGAVALRKVEGLLQAGAEVHVVSPEICDEINRLPVHTIQRGFREADLDGAALAIAATDDQAVNAAVARAAGERGIPVNVVDQPGLCSFYLPAVVRRGGLVIGVSTSGASPSLARRIRERLEDEFGSEYGQYVELLDGLRQQVIDQVTADKRRGVFEQMASDEILGILRTHGRAAAERALHQILNDAGKKPDQP